MHLVLTIENAHAIGGKVDGAKTLESGSLSIGRGAEADWQLPDRSRLLSSVHCRIDGDGRRFVLTDLSRNGLTLNDRKLGLDDAAELRSGDRIVLGAFIVVAGVFPGSAADVVGGDRTVIAANETVSAVDKTVIAGVVAEPVNQPAVAPVNVLPKAAAPGKSRPAAAPRPVSKYGSEMVAQFATAAGIDPERFAGRTDAEFVRQLGEMMRELLPAVAALARSGRELRTTIGDQNADNNDDLHDVLYGHKGALEAMFERGQEGYRLTARLVDEVLEHDRAMFPALQTALYQLFNELAPTTIERRAGASAFRSRKGRCWDIYAGTWDDFSSAGHNGILDVLLAHFREAYATRRQGD